MPDFVGQKVARIISLHHDEPVEVIRPVRVTPQIHLPLPGGFVVSGHDAGREVDYQLAGVELRDPSMSIGVLI